MATILQARSFQSADGKRFVEVLFRPQVPDPAQEESVMVVFSVRECNVPSLRGDVYAAFLESSTRAETRTPYVLSTEQREACEDAAINLAGDDDGLGWE